jgi:hypothetical protein
MGKIPTFAILVALALSGCASAPESDTLFFKGQIVGYQFIRTMDERDYPDQKPEPGKEILYVDSWFNVRFLVTDQLGGHLNGQHVNVILEWHAPPDMDRAYRRYHTRFVLARKQLDGSYVGWDSRAAEGFCMSRSDASKFGFEREWQIAHDRYPCQEKDE